MFEVLWTILLGIIGGIISSIIVSRVFMIQGEYRQQIKAVENIIGKLGLIAGYLEACRAVFELSYDENLRKKKEMQEKGYKSEMEYYYAHKDKDWISVSETLKVFKSHLLKSVEMIREEILDLNIEEKDLAKLIGNIMNYTNDISPAKELDFSTINQLKKKQNEILNEFESCKQFSGKQLFRLILKDKVMIILYILVGIIVVLTGLSFMLGL